MPLKATDEPGYWDFKSSSVVFWMVDGTQRVRCVVTLEALETFDPKLDRLGGAAPLRCFDQHRDRIETVASAKFDISYTHRTIMVRKEDL